MSAPHPPLLPHHPSTFSAVGGDGDGGDDPAKNRPRKSSHEADAAAAVGNEDDENEEGEEAAPPKQQQQQQQQQRRRRRIPEGPLQCPVCGRTFKSAKALHGHMRCHPERNWRGVTPPTTATTVRLGEKEAAADSLMLLSAQPQDQAEEEGGRFRFGTRQALGGHRASHRSKIGCYMKGKEGVSSGEEEEGLQEERQDRRRRRRRQRPTKERQWVVDLNLPPPPEDDNKDEQSPPPP
ncbi:Zinc finger protein ZAT3 [Ananas comosus]|uniref:Zinc finger protein ZAT3 n=1 Tax=Ananas comosus TaxID=4615 RepID=A0A199URK4_ANACO|nr:Zinc finger protein ZAT3 [Ananas comosus]